MEQWQASIAVNYARQDYTKREAIELAKRDIRAIEWAMKRDGQRKVEAARVRWNERRRRERVGDIHAGE